MKFVKVFGLILLETLMLSASIAASGYDVKKDTYYNFIFNDHHFMTLIDENDTLIFRPHPGIDIDGWGSSWYAQPFLPRSILSHTNINSILPTDEGIDVNASGNVSYGDSSTYGSWTISMKFKYDPSKKIVSGTGNYSIKLHDILSENTGDLNLYKVSSNYLTDVPLLDSPEETGDTGDLKQVKVIGDDFNFVWIPDEQPEHFPNDITDYLSVDVSGQYYNVNTTAQGYERIKPAYKPSLRVAMRNRGEKGLEMIFGGFYNTSESQEYWKDNVGITPVVLKQSNRTEFDFEVEFESMALPGDGS